DKRPLTKRVEAQESFHRIYPATKICNGKIELVIPSKVEVRNATDVVHEARFLNPVADPTNPQNPSRQFHSTQDEGALFRRCKRVAQPGLPTIGRVAMNNPTLGGLIDR